MGVYIKGMEMPKNCMECDIKAEDDDGYHCPFTKVTALNIGIQNNCPLVEVPEPHGRLADIEDVKKAIFDYHGEDEQKVRTMINAILSSVPTVIEAEGE